MFFPFSFNFSVPGLLNPFRSSSTLRTTTSPTGDSEQNKPIHNNTRTHQSPTSRSFHTNSKASQESDYRDRNPAPAYPSPSTYPASSSYPIPIPAPNRLSRSQLPKIPRRHSPSPPSSLRALPLSRKRGWEPTFGAESIQSLASNGKTSSTTSLTITSPTGYLDTPAKYRDMAEGITMSDDNYRESEQDNDEDAPPLKKRRGLAGSIVSTAVSAALIGTAVGLTVYRLWRDRGKEGQIANPPHQSETEQQQDPDKQAPPPPYDAGHWRAVEQPAPIPVSPSASSVSRTPRSVPATPATPTPRGGRTSKRVAAKRGHVVIAAHSARRTRTPKHGHGAGAGQGFGSPRTRPEFDFGPVRGEEGSVPQTEVEDKMDWMGDKLSMLIEQGRRALQSEVVVMSEAKEDEVDDGRGGWEEAEDEDEGEDSEFDDTHSRHGRARSGSVRSINNNNSQSTRAKVRPRNIAVPASASSPSKVGLGLLGVRASPYASGSISVSPRRSGFAPGSTASSYASASTSYTPAHASAGFASSSVPSLSPFYTATFGQQGGQGQGHGHVRGLSYESALPASSGNGMGNEEEAAGWESPELKESMERARARMLARRAAAGSGV